MERAFAHKIIGESVGCINYLIQSKQLSKQAVW